jgi:hypothetical protein
VFANDGSVLGLDQAVVAAMMRSRLTLVQDRLLHSEIGEAPSYN